MSLLTLLLVFLCRLSFGLAMAMAFVNHTHVISGFFRNHAYVLLGLNVLSALIELQSPLTVSRWMPTVAAVCSYLSAVAWLYEKPRLGKVLLIAAGISAMASGLLANGVIASDSSIGIWSLLDFCAGTLVLGTTCCAMFLGHWYLNSPSMKLDPLRRLVSQMAQAIVLRTILAVIAAIVLSRTAVAFGGLDAALLAMRWLAGLAGPLAIAWMAWQTLKIPNTQSATGILYVGVIFVFLGELAALVLSGKLGHPI
jgi:hypothetical protein